MSKTAGKFIQFTIEVECGLFYFVNIIDFYYNSTLLYKISSSTGTVKHSALSLCKANVIGFILQSWEKMLRGVLNGTDESEMRFFITSSICELKI